MRHRDRSVSALNESLLSELTKIIFCSVFFSLNIGAGFCSIKQRFKNRALERGEGSNSPFSHLTPSSFSRVSPQHSPAQQLSIVGQVAHPPSGPRGRCALWWVCVCARSMLFIVLFETTFCILLLRNKFQFCFDRLSAKCCASFNWIKLKFYWPN